jgi:hypothetical protein
MTDPLIEKLFSQEKELMDRLANVRVAIQALQKLCEHVWVYNGHDSHYNHYVCSKCGEEDNRG